MTKPRARVLTLIAVLAGALLSIPTLTADAAQESAQVQGRQRFTFIQTNPEEAESGPVAANGAIHAKGTDIVINERRDRLEFPDGNVFLRHKTKKGSASDSYDPTTCLFTFTERGTWSANRGTGDYEDVEGAGTYSVIGQGFGCDQNEPPEVFYVKIVAVGSLSY